MPDKQTGQVDPTGNYGMSQAEADKARAWAKVREWVDAPRRADADREAEKAKLGAALPPVRMPRAQQCAAGRAPAQPDEKAKGTPTEPRPS